MVMSAETDIAEIIRRLFEWGGLPDDAKKTAVAYTVRARVDSLEAAVTVEVASPDTPPLPPPPPPTPRGLSWQGSVPPQKWMNFYTRVLSRFVTAPGLTLEVRFSVPDASPAQADETRTALRELGLSEDLESS
jgi:hypothetical protein